MSNHNSYLLMWCGQCILLCWLTCISFSSCFFFLLKIQSKSRTSSFVFLSIQETAARFLKTHISKAQNIWWVSLSAIRDRDIFIMKVSGNKSPGMCDSPHEGIINNLLSSPSLHVILQWNHCLPFLCLSSMHFLSNTCISAGYYVISSSLCGRSFAKWHSFKFPQC